MDFMDSLDLESTSRRNSEKVRSWYLIEQYKSLEKNQLDAAQKLRDRSYQENILLRELNERKERRRLCDQFGLCQSEPRLIQTEHPLDLTVNDIYESLSEHFSESQDEQFIRIMERDVNCEELDADSIDDSKTDSQFEEFRFESDDEEKQRASFESVVEKINNNKTKSVQNLVDDRKERCNDSKSDEAQNIELYLESVEEKDKVINKISNTMLYEQDIGDRSSGIADQESTPKATSISKTIYKDSNILMLWSRLVSFAYQVMQLNHGNCYFDYSSQLLTAVIACDILRLGMYRMCDILQPYVSPIKYFADDDKEQSLNSILIDSIQRKHDEKAIQRRKKSSKCKTHKPLSTKLKEKLRKQSIRRNYRSEDLWQYLPTCREPSDAREDSFHTATEPMKSVSRMFYDKEMISITSTSSLWPQEFTKHKNCTRTRPEIVTNPMIKVVQYIDSISELDYYDSKNIY